MGICKCRKRSELFCYHCEKAVCFDCITEPSHKLAKVTTYVEWLNKPDNPPPVCPLSNKPLTEKDEVIRFMNMQIFLLEAINEYGSSLPNVTALAGFTIPGTEEPMVPPPEDHSKLAQQIREKLSRFPWISDLISLQRENSLKNSEKAEKPGITEFPANKTASRKALSPEDYTPTPSIGSQSVIASRKTTIPSGNLGVPTTTNSDFSVDLGSMAKDDDPEYKYRPKPIRKVFEALGFISSATMSKAQHYQFSGRRAAFIFALLITLVIVFFYGCEPF